MIFTKLKWGISFFVVMAAVLVGAAQATAAVGPGLGAGDEDPFPLLCVDFSGKWRSDSGSRYIISQRGCSWLKIDMSSGTSSETLTIVPDNRERFDDKGVSIRHRWNSNQHGTLMETYRALLEKDQKVTEVIVLEQVSPDLLLQTTYRTMESNDGSGEVRHDVSQQVFRRVAKD